MFLIFSEVGRGNWTRVGTYGVHDGVLVEGRVRVFSRAFSKNLGNYLSVPWKRSTSRSVRCAMRPTVAVV